jgi:hypothetical protein
MVGRLSRYSMQLFNIVLTGLCGSDILNSISIGKTTLFMLFYQFCCLGVESLRPVSWIGIADWFCSRLQSRDALA